MFRAISAVIVTAIMGCALAIGCDTTPSSVSSGPDASTAPAAHIPMALSPNNVNDIGNAVIEVPLIAWAKTAADLTTTQDAGTSETVFGSIGAGPQGIPIKSIAFAPAAALTASDTQNAVISVYKRTNYDAGAGTVQVLLGTASTFTPGKDGGTGNWNAWTPVNFTMVTANAPFVSPGDVITMVIAKNGTTGVSVPAGTLSIFTGP
jgi:hypothetical protein